MLRTANEREQKQRRISMPSRRRHRQGARIPITASQSELHWRIVIRAEKLFLNQSETPLLCRLAMHNFPGCFAAWIKTPIPSQIRKKNICSCAQAHRISLCRDRPSVSREPCNPLFQGVTAPDKAERYHKEPA